ncbi:3-(cis-5,6-dihydroxycyclohexa-1,3-dien-1-yl)propanoate dehydrogenase [Haloglycomyces albus]|uniref:3-(cis-5,6-dihydroxycyclohexa-1, 3-dien-1-yl)propanoate dehydrogenase n=1 Tax=Haloglycomyces albus TaxID=526067 RepID=UPI00046D821C|nr:3-(cis-5,6-dihydroxycyclohexa-1,3-dien-1-yl)propanoate dehydrogenase [Haloglycomyces albus]
MGQLDGYVAIVTGGGSGIGRAVVDRFVAEGACVGVLLRDKDQAKRLHADHGESVITTLGDVREWDSNRRVVSDTLATFGRLDTMIPNAGVYDFFQGLEDMDGDAIGERFDELFDVNVKGYLLAARAAVEELRSTRGSLIFTLSSSSLYSGGGGILYVSAKHALVGTVRQLAFELAPDVRVNAVAPGATRTPLSGVEGAGKDKQLSELDGFESMVEKTVPLGFLSEPQDHASLYVTLASREASPFTTAAVIPSDGGLEVRGGGRRRKGGG